MDIITNNTCRYGSICKGINAQLVCILNKLEIMSIRIKIILFAGVISRFILQIHTASNCKS